MSATRWTVCVFLVAVFAAWCAPHAGAQRVQIGLQSDTVQQGEVVRLQVVAQDAQRIESLDIDAPDGLRVLHEEARPGRRFYSHMENGRNISSLVLTLDVPIIAEEAGTYDLGLIAVVVDGEEFTRDDLSLEVFPSDRTELVLGMSVDQRRPYVGQPIRLTVEFSVLQGLRVGNPTFGFAETGDDFEVRAVESASRNIAGEVSVLGVRAPVLPPRAERINGRDHLTYTVTLELVPKVAGRTRIGPGTLRAQLSDGGAFFNRRGTRFVSAAAEPITIEVRELPATGRPAGYTGLVGGYEVAASASPTDVSVGDPIRLSLVVRAERGSTEPAQPELGLVPDIRSRFRVEAIPEDRERQGETTRFVYRVRPLSGDVTEIPPIELHYFDPMTGGYEVARTDAIPLDVEAVRVVGFADAEGGGAVGGGRAPERVETASLPPPITDAERAVRNDIFGWDRVVGSPTMMAAVVLPPAGAMVSAGVALLATRRPGSGRSVGEALRAAREAVTDQDRAEPERASLAIAAYVGVRTGVDRRAMTSAECVQYIGEVDRQMGDEAERLLTDCDAARFSGGVGSDSSLVDRARDLVERLSGKETR